MIAALVVAVPASAQDADVSEGLVGWWLFDGLVDGKVPERTGAGGPAELVGVPPENLDPERGLFVPYEDLPGVAVSRDHPLMRGQPERFTVTAWVWRDDQNRGGGVVFCPNRFVLAMHVWEVHYSPDTPRDWAHVIRDTPLPPAFSWVHLAGVADGEELRFYRNGELVGSASLPKPIAEGGADLELGRAFSGKKWQVSGYLREARLYDRVLSGEEIARLAAVRPTSIPADLPERGLYLPARAGRQAAAFDQPALAPFERAEKLELTLTREDAARLSADGCGVFRVLDPALWRDHDMFEIAGRARATSPVRARLVFVGWREGDVLLAPQLVTIACSDSLILTPEGTDLGGRVRVPGEVVDGAIMLVVDDQRDDPASLVGVTVAVDDLSCAMADSVGEGDAKVAITHLAATSGDGLSLGVSDTGDVLRLTRDEAILGGDAFPTAGWFVTDLAGDGMPRRLTAPPQRCDGGAMWAGSSETLAIEYETRITGGDGFLDCRAHLRDLTGADRALRLEFRLPLTSEEVWTWHDGRYRPRVVAPGRRFELPASGGNLSPGGQPNYSLYPFANLSSPRGNVALAVPLMDRPSLPRLFAEKSLVGGTVLVCQFDVGLSPETRHMPSQADYGFIVYHTETDWPFRRTVQRYFDLFPDQFRTTAPRHGNWTVLARELDIPNLADFAIAADETHLGTPWAERARYVSDHIYDIPPLPYHRPGTWSVRFPGSWDDENAYEKRTALLAEYEALPLDRYLWATHWNYWGSPISLMVQATRNSVLHDREGRDIWGWNARWEPTTYFNRNTQYLSYEVPEPNWAQVLERQYGLMDRWSREAGTPLGGMYFDNICSYSIREFDYRRDHWALARTPLVVALDPAGPAQAKVLQLCEFLPRFRSGVHERGGFMIGNFNGACGFQLAQHFDFIGVEGYKGNLVEQIRVMAGARPASYLVHNGSRDVFDNCLSYGVAPGFLGGNIKRRELYREFMPLIIEVAEAGWQPVPHARHSSEVAVVERFGDFGSGTLSFTVRDVTADSADGRLVINAGALGVPDAGVRVMDLRTGEAPSCERRGDELLVDLPLTAGRTEVVRICAAEDWRRRSLARVAGALDRATREWAWLQAKCDGSLRGTNGFEDNQGRWTYDGLEGADVGIVEDAHGGEGSLGVTAEQPVSGRLRADAFVLWRDEPHHVSLFHRSEGTGRISVRLLHLRNYRGESAGEDQAIGGNLAEGRWDDGWREVAADVDPPSAANRLVLELVFEDFAGRFALDDLSLLPLLEPLATVPEFGFATARDELQAELAAGDLEDAAGITEQVRARLPEWREMAAGLADDDRRRMDAEIAVVESALAAWDG
jgi:hypothetical protein